MGGAHPAVGRGGDSVLIADRRLRSLSLDALFDVLELGTDEPMAPVIAEVRRRMLLTLESEEVLARQVAAHRRAVEEGNRELAEARTILEAMKQEWSTPMGPDPTLYSPGEEPA